MKKTAFMGLLLAFALILGYVESLVPFYFGIPGIKLGLANFAIVMTLYLIGAKESLVINGLRIILSAFLFGNMYTMIYSLAGGLLSNFAMIACKMISGIDRLDKSDPCKKDFNEKEFDKKNKGFSIVGVSMIGGVFHNIGQLVVAYFVVRTTGVIFYAPMLLISGIITGFLIGVIQNPVQKRIKHLIV